MSKTSERLSSIKTYILIAFIFSILVEVGWAIGFLVYFISFISILFIPYIGIWVAAMSLIPAIVFLILAIPSIMVLRRTWAMYNACQKNDIKTLKKLNSTGWAVIALIFSGIIPGIMLLIAKEPIDELKEGDVSAGAGIEDLDRLAKLKSMLDQGLITQEEYNAQKARILSGQSQVSGEEESVESQLAKLKQMLDSGAITKQEYEQLKKKLLGQL